MKFANIDWQSTFIKDEANSSQRIRSQIM